MPEISLRERLEQLESEAIESFTRTKDSYYEGSVNAFCLSEHEVREMADKIEALPEPLSKVNVLRLLRGDEKK